jgi:hypothetical protein
VDQRLGSDHWCIRYPAFFASASLPNVAVQFLQP